MPWTAHASTTAACPPFCGYSSIPLDTHMYFFQSRRSVTSEALAHVLSLFVMMDEESVHVLSLEDDVGCVVAVEAQELLAESGRARRTSGCTAYPSVPGVSITLAKMRGKWAFTISPVLTVVRWFWSVICWHSPAMHHAFFIHASRTSSERAQELPSLPIFVTEKSTNVGIERNRKFTAFLLTNPSLNKRTEMVSTCHHQRKFLVPWAVTCT